MKLCQIHLSTLGGFRTPTPWGWRVEEEEERVSYKSQLILLPAWRSKDRESPFALFLFGHALFEKERRKGFPFFQEWQKKSLRLPVLSILRLGIPLPHPPPKKKITKNPKACIPVWYFLFFFWGGGVDAGYPKGG